MAIIEMNERLLKAAGENSERRVKNAVDIIHEAQDLIGDYALENELDPEKDIAEIYEFIDMLCETIRETGKIGNIKVEYSEQKEEKTCR